MKCRSSSFVWVFSVSAFVCLIGLAGCGSRAAKPGAEATSVAGTVVAQITATAQAAGLPTSIAQTVVAELTARAPSSTPAKLATENAAPTATPIPAVTRAPVPTITPGPTNMPRPTATPSYGALTQPVPIGVTVTRHDSGSIFMPYEISITILDVARGADAEAVITKNGASVGEKPKSDEEYVAVKVGVEVPTAPAYKQVSFEPKMHLGYWYVGDNHPYSILYLSGSSLDGYAPLSGEMWAYFVSRKGIAPLFYFRHDMWWGTVRWLDGAGVFFSLDRAAAVARGQASTPSASSGSLARVVADANLRSGPGTTYPIVGSAAKDAAMAVTGRDASPAQWWQVVALGDQKAWVSVQLVTVTGADSVPIVNTPPTPASKPPSIPQGTAIASDLKWVLVADSAADFPGGRDRNDWYYLWTAGRNNFEWRDMGRANPSACYRDADNRGLEICQDSIKADPRGDVGVQWKASRGGTYRFEWDSPSLRLYKHATLMGSRGKGSDLPYSATIEGVIDWEMFFWVADSSTSYHIRVYRLAE